MQLIMRPDFQRRFIHLVVGCMVLTAASLSLQAKTQTTFYVSPKGDDSNPGTSELLAFASLEKARDAVRSIKSEMTGDIIVEVAKGDYTVKSTITFDEKDSGTNGFNVIYKSQDDIGAARLIGGTKASGWAPYKGNIYMANVGPGLGFTTLYENGIRADLARWPKRTSPFAVSRGGYMTLVSNKEGRHFEDSAFSPDGTPFAPAGMNFDNAWAYYWDGGDGHRWSSATSAVASVKDGVISLKQGGMGDEPDSFLIEGSLDLLTRPGEFFYDKTAGTLYYYSRFNGGIEKQEVIVPLVVRMIDISGSTPSDAARNIQFSGLVFIGTDRIAQSGLADWSDAQQSSWDSAIYLKNAQNITFQNCLVADTGMSAITADSNTDSCVISGCLIEHAGYHGVSLINGSNHTVNNCVIRYIGELRGHGDGVSIMFDPKREDGKSDSATFCKHTLSHLEVYDVARAGLAIRGKGDTIQYVKVHDCVQDSGDQGAFYLVDPASFATFDQCTSFHNYCDLSNMDRPPTAVYNDRDAHDTVWSNIDAGDSQMYVFRHDPQKVGTLTFNNVSWDPRCNPRGNEVAGPVNPDFDKSKMEYDKIGVTADFPAVYNDLSSAPVAPLNFWAQTGDKQASLHWTEADRATTYAIKRATTSGGPYTPVGKSEVPPTGPDLGADFTDTGLTNGVSYYYVVTASNKAGESLPSTEIQVTPNHAGSNKLSGTTIGTGGKTDAAFDGDLKTYFQSPNGWAGLDLGSPNIITELRYSPRSDNTDTTARLCGGKFEASNDPDFTDAVTLYRVLATKGGAGTPVLIPQAIYDKTPYRYVRFIGSSGNSLIGEVEFYGYPRSAVIP
jgi:hypothetical protein